MTEGKFNREPTLVKENKVQVGATGSHTPSKSFKILQFIIEIPYDR
jgi:hypothetical protein